MKRANWCAVGLLSLAATVGLAPGSPPVESLPDGVNLSVTPGPGPDEILLRWTGGLPPFTVYRSTNKTPILDPANELGLTTGRTWIDAPPAGAIFYYELRSAGCSSNAGCPGGFCVDGYCCSTACGGPCETCDLPGAEGSCMPVPAGEDPSGECGPGSACDGLHGCLTLDGGLCVLGSDCLSGHCADGRCCDSACSSLCEQCDAAGSVGTCIAVPAGADPHDDCAGAPPSTCGLSGFCSGNRACALHPAGTVCVPGSCAAAGSAQRDDLCNGSGTCVDGGVQDCAPYLCGSGGGCLSSCTTHAECQPGFLCDQESGRLTPTRQRITLPSPVCLVFRS